MAKDHQESVIINVYDMYWLNEYAANLGLGIYHSGVEVYGTEYCYGGHPFHFSGIFETTPQDADELGENFKFREALVVGCTNLRSHEVNKIIQEMGRDYKGDQYHLINRNCNHFTHQLVKKLTGQEAPAWINRLASISGSIPFIDRWIPQEWVTPLALQNSLDQNQANNHRSLIPPIPCSMQTQNSDQRQNASSSAREISTAPKTNQSKWRLFQKNTTESSSNGNISEPSTARTNGTNNLPRLWSSSTRASQLEK